MPCPATFLTDRCPVYYTGRECEWAWLHGTQFLGAVYTLGLLSLSARQWERHKIEIGEYKIIKIQKYKLLEIKLDRSLLHYEILIVMQLCDKWKIDIIKGVKLKVFFLQNIGLE